MEVAGSDIVAVSASLVTVMLPVQEVRVMINRCGGDCVRVGGEVESVDVFLVTSLTTRRACRGMNPSD